MMKTVKRKHRRNNLGFLWLMVLAVMLVIFIIGCGGTGADVAEDDSPTAPPSPTSSPTSTPTSTPVTDISIEPISTGEAWVPDLSNIPYPYNSMSADWGVDIYERGFRYWEIPVEYQATGGEFPEIAQVYLWCLCEQYEVDYYTVLAIIERESGYKWDATGDSGNSKGLMQVQERWHIDRMRKLGAEDLYNPYDNMTVAVDYLAEMSRKYLASSGENCVLMAYNMGATGAKRQWNKGIYSTNYSRGVLQRASEIKREIQALQDW